MAINSRQKGCRGEREFCEFLKQQSPSFDDARRSRQYCGYTGAAADIKSELMERLKISPEVKRVEAGNPYKWLEQATRDAKAGGNKPVVFHKRNGEDWIAVMHAADLTKILDELDAHRVLSHNTELGYKYED